MAVVFGEYSYADVWKEHIHLGRVVASLKFKRENCWYAKGEECRSY